MVSHSQSQPFHRDINDDAADAPPTEQERQEMIEAVQIAIAVGFLRSRGYDLRYGGVAIGRPDDIPCPVDPQREAMPW